jgi:preprotein translocase subunit SecF
MEEQIEQLLKNHAKKLMAIPIILILLSCFLLLNFQAQTGEFFQKDVSLSGGMTVTFYSENTIDKDSLKQSLQEKFSEISIRGLSELGTAKEIGIVIETPEIDEDSMKSAILEATGIELTEENSSIEVVGSSLGESFYNQMVKALIFAFIFMSIVVLITFRKLLPSLAVVIVALGDLIITVTIINLLGIKVSSAGIAALLLLIGYSIDTDVLLTTRLLKKREGTVVEGVLSSIKTGLTMSVTTISALGAAYLVSTSLILKQMFLIIIIGLVVDIILTYLLNAPMLATYAEKQRGRVN